MSEPEAIWSYQGSDAERIARLSERFEFAELVEQLATSSRVLAGSVFCGLESPGRYYRVEYWIEVGRDLFDQFFNSVDGYRGQYYRSPADGIRANLQLLHRLTDLLVTHQELDSPHVTEELWKPWVNKWCNRSLQAKSARAWLCETGKGSEHGEWGVDTTDLVDASLIRIRNGVWEQHEHHGFQDGTIAPELKNIHILGAFIDPNGNEWVPESKVMRAVDIHKSGWT